MIRVLLAATLIACGVLACSRETTQPAAASSTEAPAKAPAAVPAQAAAPAPTDAASASQESSGDAAEGQPDAALERLATIPAADELPGGRWKAGVNYKPIVPAQPTDVPAGKVEVMEVFWYGCGHCYALEPYMTSWEAPPHSTACSPNRSVSVSSVKVVRMPPARSPPIALA